MIPASATSTDDRFTEVLGAAEQAAAPVGEPSEDAGDTAWWPLAVAAGSVALGAAGPVFVIEMRPRLQQPGQTFGAAAPVAGYLTTRRKIEGRY